MGLAQASVVNIPISDERLPSNDLIYQGQVLSPEQALNLKKNSPNKNILAQLNPFENDLWENSLNMPLEQELDELPIENNETVDFLDTIVSNSTILFFNVLKRNNRNSQTFKVTLEKNLHTALLRKNLLRKLGYKVPKMKYLKKLKIRFDSVERRDYFLQTTIAQKTFGAAERWVTNLNELSEENNQNLTVELQDLFIMMPSEKDHNNLAFFCFNFH